MNQEKNHEKHFADFKEFLEEIEKTFAIRIRSNEFRNLHTFGALCDLVVAKINLRNQNTSGIEHAFIGLRAAIASTLNISKEEIQMDSKLISLFPRHSRRKAIRELNYEYGFDLKVLRPYLIIEGFLLLFLFAAIAAFFFQLILGLEALALLILLINLAFLTGKEFNVETVGELCEKIIKLRNANTKRRFRHFSEEEIVEELKFIFGEFIPSSGEINVNSRIRK